MALNFPAAPSLNDRYTYNGKTYVWKGSYWALIGANPQDVYVKTDFTATAGQTSFSVAYTVGYVDVWLNGVKLIGGGSDYTATNGTSIVLATGASLNDIVEVVAWNPTNILSGSFDGGTADSPSPITIQYRRDTSSNWVAIDPILAEGEIGFETDTDKVKIGDGTTPWISLGYVIDPVENTTLSGVQTLANKTLVEPTITGTVVEDIYTLTDDATVDVDPGNGSIQLLTLTGTGRTLTFTNMVNGEAITLMVNDGTDGTITTWNATFVNNGAAAPTLSTTGYTVVSLWKVGGVVYAALVGDGS